MPALLGKIRRGLKMPPRVLARRLVSEAHRSLDRLLVPARARRSSVDALLRATGAASIDALWARLAAQPYVSRFELDRQTYERLCPGDEARILAAAERAVRREVDLLGSGPVLLGDPIDWLRDYKTGHIWPRQYAHDIDYNNPDRPSDVKVPWEISRVQWLIPLGQAYHLTGDERWAAAAREVLSSWIAQNPCLGTVNWACTMEVALRVLSWTWLFRAFHGSRAWADDAFRAEFLNSLYWHGRLTERYLEHGDVNGNHCTADAAGMVFAGLFFGGHVIDDRGEPSRWAERGWKLLCEELPRQVFADGVDFEASIPYHRLVLELFFLPALFRQRRGLDVPAWYRERVIAMAQFTAAYSRDDGSVPLVGDADDARALPFGGQDVNDHRYLLGLVGAAWDVPELKAWFSGPTAEVVWLLGAEACSQLNEVSRPIASPRRSQAFVEGGFFVMRNSRDHVLIDCGPVGLAGRGGHGHNDCLSFEASLLGQTLVTDCGSYVYTASYHERNLFRSTSCHNTPQVAGHEINRFISPNHLWTVHYDAVPELRRWETSQQRDVLVGSHSGYLRLRPAVRPIRTIVLDHHDLGLVIRDRFEVGEQAEQRLALTPALSQRERGEVSAVSLIVPLHLAEGVTTEQVDEQSIELCRARQRFLLTWPGEGWKLAIQPARVSPSYGVVRPIQRLAWSFQGAPPVELCVVILPLGVAEDALRWSADALAGVDA
jgi:uncharacterized heparinase superfamily protein